MKSIKFSASELEFLQNHYELELTEAENYISEIKNILKKLGVAETESVKEKPAKSQGKKRGRPRKEEVAGVQPEITPVVKESPKKSAKKAEKKAPKKMAAKTAKAAKAAIPSTGETAVE
ncbi:MAG: hypothetical protein WCK34_03145 [Bacteroidota bacterium]